MFWTLTVQQTPTELFKHLCTYVICFLLYSREEHSVERVAAVCPQLVRGGVRTGALLDVHLTRRAAEPLRAAHGLSIITTMVLGSILQWQTWSRLKYQCSENCLVNRSVERSASPGSATGTQEMACFTVFLSCKGHDAISAVGLYLPPLLLKIDSLCDSF